MPHFKKSVPELAVNWHNQAIKAPILRVVQGSTLPLIFVFEEWHIPTVPRPWTAQTDPSQLKMYLAKAWAFSRKSEQKKEMPGVSSMTRMIRLDLEMRISHGWIVPFRKTCAFFLFCMCACSQLPVPPLIPYFHSISALRMVMRRSDGPAERGATMVRSPSRDTSQKRGL